MFRFMEKSEVFAAADSQIGKVYLDRYDPHRRGAMKNLQDLWIVSELFGKKNKKIAEIGGAYCRVLRLLEGNERWNIEKHQGTGRLNFDKKPFKPSGIKLVNAYVGEYSKNIPDNYFDFLYSISVIEHIPQNKMNLFFQDHARMLKSGGRGLHAIDFYLGNSENAGTEEKIDVYLKAINESGLRPLRGISVNRPAVFSTSYATAPDFIINQLNSLAPQIANIRLKKQSVSLSIVVEKM